MKTRPLTNFLKIGFLFFVSVGVAFAQTTTASGTLDTISNNFQQGSSGWMTTAQGIAQSLFSKLLVLDLAWWGIKNVLKKNDLADWLTGFFLKMISLLFFWVLITEAPTWIPLVTQSFTQIGKSFNTSGTSALTPSGIVVMAYPIVQQLGNVIQGNPSDSLGGSVVNAVTTIVSVGWGQRFYGRNLTAPCERFCRQRVPTFATRVCRSVGNF